jgi:ribosomal protein S27AE
LFRDRVEEQVGYECDYLMNGTAVLNHAESLDQACISSESMIIVHNDLDGGKRKRKKKVYTKPKKVKHVHKKRSKQALDYFQVDNAGKVIELKQKTTQGQGWFMADHQDRHVCGATGHTMWKTGPDGKRLPPPVQKHIVKEVGAVVKKASKKGKKK